MPARLRWAGYAVAVEGVAGLVTAIVLIIRAATGSGDQSIASGYGTAGWFVIIFGGVFAGGIALTAGRRWGRGIAIIAQILLLPFSYALWQSGWAGFAAPVAVLAVVILVLLFHPDTVRWLEEGDLPPDAGGAPKRR